MKAFTRQGKCSFWAPHRGHEVTQLESSPNIVLSGKLNLVSRTAYVGFAVLRRSGCAKALEAEGKELPMLFVIQNNGYIISVPQRIQTASSIRKIAKGFGIHAVKVDGTSYEYVYEAARPRKTNRIVISHEDSLTDNGVGAELVACIATNCIDALDASVLRVTAKDSFVPSAPRWKRWSCLHLAISARVDTSCIFQLIRTLPGCW